MLTKIILFCVLVILIMLIANGVAKQYKDKCLIYNDILSFLNYYELNIGFKKDKMLQLVSTFNASNCSKPIFDSYLIYLKEDKEIDLDTLKIIEDKEYLIEMLTSLGKGDYEQELKKILSHKMYYEKKLNESEANKNKICPLILKLSFLFSLLVIILIV